MTTQHILLLGATGFIGGGCLTHLLNNKELSIHVMVRNTQQFMTQMPGIEKQVTLFEGDIRDINALNKACNQVTAVIHAASKSIDTDHQGFHEINVNGTMNVCQACIKNNVDTLIYISSCGVYGHNSCSGLSENALLHPDTDFSMSKYQAEKIVLAAHDNNQLNSIVLRHRFVYGYGDRHVIPRFINSMKKYPFVINKGKAKLSFISINDLADIIMRFIHNTTPLTDPVFNVTDGTPLSIMELYAILHEVFELPMPKYSLPYWPLYYLATIKERFMKDDPDSTMSSFTTHRLNFVSQDSYFSNEKLKRFFNDLHFLDFQSRLKACKTFYQPGLN